MTQYSTKIWWVSLLFSLFAFSTTAQAAPAVKLIYLIPSDKNYNAQYEQAILNAANNIREFYRDEIGVNKTFILDGAVEVIHSSQNSAWFAASPWTRAKSESGAKHGDADFTYVVYMDARPACGQVIGGADGVAVLGENDLLGLTGQLDIPACAGGRPENASIDRWIGGLGHEIGHAFGLPHPPGCEEEQSHCDNDALLWNGFRSYPDTYLRSDEIAILKNSRFIVSDQISPLAEDRISWQRNPELCIGESGSDNKVGLWSCSANTDRYDWTLMPATLSGSENRFYFLNDADRRRCLSRHSKKNKIRQYSFSDGKCDESSWRQWRIYKPGFGYITADMMKNDSYWWKTVGPVSIRNVRLNHCLGTSSSSSTTPRTVGCSSVSHQLFKFIQPK